MDTSNFEPIECYGKKYKRKQVSKDIQSDS